MPIRSRSLQILLRLWPLAWGRLDLASVLLNVSISIPRFWPLSISFPHEFPRFGTHASRVRPMKCSGSVEGNLGIEMHLQVCPQLPLVRHTIPGLNHTAREYRVLLPALLVFPVCDPLVPSRYGLSLFKINDAGVADVRGRHAHPWSCPPPLWPSPTTIHSWPHLHSQRRSSDPFSKTLTTSNESLSWKYCHLASKLYQPSRWDSDIRLHNVTNKPPPNQ